MHAMTEIPQEALDLRYNSGGFLPDVGLYRRGDMFYQEASKAHRWLFGILLVAALVVSLLPWHTRAIVGELKYWIAGMLLFGGFCDLVGSLIQSAVRQRVSIDPKHKTLSIVGSDFKTKLCWEDIIGLQICRQRVAGNSEMNGYQLNLVWREADGSVRRHCLLKHASRGFVTRLAGRYRSFFGFTVMDYTRRSQPDVAANRSQPLGSETNRTPSAAGSGR